VLVRWLLMKGKQADWVGKIALNMLAAAKTAEMM
jgi:hypothetical protein